MRKIVASGLALILAGCSPTIQSPPIFQPFTKTNIIIEGCSSGPTFDTLQKVKGARKIKYFPIKDAKRQVIHIRQRHPVPRSSEYDSVEYDPLTENVQKEIYQILSSLFSPGEAHPVYIEGMWAENEKSIKNTLQEIRTLRNYASFLASKPELSQRYEALVVLHQFQSDFLKNNGTLRAELEDRVLTIPAESKEIHFAEDKVEDEDEKLLLRTEPREDYLLSILDMKSPLSVIIYGGAHAFGGKESCGKNYSHEGRISFIDNLAKYNKEHPDSKIELIEVTPLNYIELNFVPYRNLLKD